MAKYKCPFKLGDVVVFEPKNFNKSYWDSETEENKIKYYGALGYGSSRPKHFVFITEINPALGHCVLVSLDDQSVETFRHTSDFRKATEEEL